MCTKSQILNDSRLILQLLLPNSLKPGVKSRIKMSMGQRWQAMLQLHLSDQQVYCLLRCILYWMFNSTFSCFFDLRNDFNMMGLFSCMYSYYTARLAPIHVSHMAHMVSYIMNYEYMDVYYEPLNTRAGQAGDFSSSLLGQHNGVSQWVLIVMSPPGVLMAWNEDSHGRLTVTYEANNTYCQTSNISCTLVGNKIVDHSDIIGALPVGAAPTTSPFLT